MWDITNIASALSAPSAPPKDHAWDTVAPQSGWSRFLRGFLCVCCCKQNSLSSYWVWKPEESHNCPHALIQVIFLNLTEEHVVYFYVTQRRFKGNFGFVTLIEVLWAGTVRSQEIEDVLNSCVAPCSIRDLILDQQKENGLDERRGLSLNPTG